jgi:hypothetical protein
MQEQWREGNADGETGGAALAFLGSVWERASSKTGGERSDELPQPLSLHSLSVA